MSAKAVPYLHDAAQGARGGTGIDHDLADLDLADLDLVDLDRDHNLPVPVHTALVQFGR
jgi:hypothetical protein